MPIIELFFDIVSPFSRIQHELLMRQLNHWKSMNLKMTPVLIRGVFSSAENMPPGMNPLKGKYLLRDLKLVSKFHKIPFGMPKNFMEIALELKVEPVQLFLAAIQDKLNNEIYNRLVGAFYEKFFQTNPTEVWNKDVMKKICNEMGISSDVIDQALSQMEHENVKKKLADNLERVKELGGFGLPITLIHLEKPEWVFGSDRMHIIAHLIKEKQPIF